MENKRNIIIIISVCIVLVISVSLLLILNIGGSKHEEDEVNTTTTTAPSVDKTFRGYKTYDLTDSDNVSMDIEKYYEFVFTSTESNDINNDYRNKSYNYTISIEDGELIFREAVEKAGGDGYQETGMTYQFRTDNKITSFTVTKSNEPNKYAIIVMDDKNNVYAYENDENEKSITKIISNIKKIKTISKVKRVGYYNYSNVPGLKNNGYDLIYEDTTNNIRYLSGKNSLFFEDAYYRYLGYDSGSEYVYVFKDRTMRLTGNDNTLNNGNKHISYRGAFYTYDESKMIENLYIIGDDCYLYYIKDLNPSSLPLLNKINVKKIKRIGTQVMRDENSFATSRQRILVEFEDGELYKLDDVLDFELL